MSIARERRLRYLHIDGKVIELEILQEDAFDFPHFINHRRINAIVDDLMPDVIFNVAHGVIDVQQRVPEFIGVETIDVLMRASASARRRTLRPLTVPFKVGSYQRA